MLKGPLTRKIIQFALPIVLTSNVQQLFNSPDTAVIGVVSAEPLLRLISTPAEILSDACDYLRVYCLAVPLLTVYDFGAAVLRSCGDSKRPLAALIVSGAVNVLHCLQNERSGRRACHRDSNGAQRGVGWSALHAIETVVGTCLFRIAWVFNVFARFRDLQSLYIVFPITWVVTSALVGASCFFFLGG